MADVATVLTSQVTVTTSAQQLATGQVNSQGGVVVKALSGNSTSNVYVGGSSAVTASTGFELAAGASQLFPVENIDELWVIASTGSPKVSWLII